MVSPEFVPPEHKPGRDYYRMLGLTREATHKDVLAAYSRNALKFHPNKNDTEYAAKVFEESAEAFDVLSHPDRKGVYDLYGESGLKSSFRTANVTWQAYKFDKESDPIRVFNICFQPLPPFFDVDGKPTFRCLLSEIVPPTPPKPIVPAEPQQCSLFIDLEDIYSGAYKVVEYKLHIAHGANSFTETLQLPVYVTPGQPDTTTFTFHREFGASRHQPGYQCDIQVVVLTNPHPRFTREGANLRCTGAVDLLAALTGGTVDIEHLDGRNLSIPVTSIIQPNSIMRLPGEGMPQEDGTKGDLLIDFNIHFPSDLTKTQKKHLFEALAHPAQ